MQYCQGNTDKSYAGKIKGPIHFHANRNTKTATPATDLSAKNLKLVNKAATVSHSIDTGSDTEDFTVVIGPRKKRQRRSLNFGTGQSMSDGCTFAGREVGSKKAWLFVSRVKDGVTEDAVRSYIVKKTDLSENEVAVEQISTTYERADSNCFRVGVKFEVKDLLYQREFWPHGVAFRRFQFRFDRQNNSAVKQDCTTSVS